MSTADWDLKSDAKTKVSQDASYEFFALDSQNEE